MKIEEFEALSVVGKTIALGLVDAYKVREKADKEVLVDCHKADILCFRGQDIAVVVNTEHDSYMACVLIGGKWKPTNAYYATRDEAYLSGLATKYRQAEFYFTSFAGKMLGIEQ